MIYDDFKTLKRALALVEGANRQLIHLSADVAKHYEPDNRLINDVCKCIEELNTVRDRLIRWKLVETTKLKGG